MEKYRALKPLYRGKIKPGDLIPEDYNIDVSWIENGLVELIKTETKKPVKKPTEKIKEVDTNE